MRALAVEGNDDMGRRRNAAERQAVTLPKLGPNGDLARQETARVVALLARDALDAERDGRRKIHGYNDVPASMRNYEEVGDAKTQGGRRFRALPGDHPLVKAWVNRKIPENEFEAGNRYRLVYERANDPAGRDSTNAMTIDRSRTGGGETAYMADVQACKDAIAGLHARMGEVDQMIVEKFCGLALSAAAAVDSSVICLSGGRSLRLREALRALEKAMRNVRLPEIAPELTYPRQGAA